MSLDDSADDGIDDNRRPSSAPLGSSSFVNVVAGLLSVSLVYGAWSIIAKATLTSSGIKPLVLATYRCLGGGTVMLVVQRLQRCTPYHSGKMESTKGDRPSATRFVALGLLMAANIGGNILALAELSALTVSIFQPTLPIFAGAFAYVLGVEDLSLTKALGVVCSACGAIMVISLGEARSSAGDDRGNVPQGVSFLLLNVSAGALFTVLQKNMVRVYPPMLVAGMAQVIAGMVIFPVAVLNVGFSRVAWNIVGNSMALAAVLYSTFLTTAYNYTVLAWANRETTPTTVMGFMTTQPAFASLLSWLILGVVLTRWQALGGMVIAAGLIIFVSGQFFKVQTPTYGNVPSVSVGKNAV